MQEGQNVVALDEVTTNGGERKGLTLRYSPSGPVPLDIVSSDDELPSESQEPREEVGEEKNNKKAKGKKEKKKKEKKKKKKRNKKKRGNSGDVEGGSDTTDDEAPDEKSIPVTSKFVLRTWEETPFYLRGNKFIRTGYRVNFSLLLCCTSMCRIHNETWNIWTHLLGFVSFVILSALTFGLWLHLPATPKFDDYIIFAVFLVCAMGQMLFSALFHQFCCRSSGVYRWGARLDYSGMRT